MLEESTESEIIEIKEKPLKLGNRLSRTLAFLLDILLIGLFIGLILTRVIIPLKFSEPMKEVAIVIEEIQAVEDRSVVKQKLESLSDDAKHMISYSQGFVVICLWLYFALSEIFLNGSSLGKRIFCLKVMSLKTFDAPNLIDVLLRSGIKTITLIAFFPVLLVNYLIAFITVQNQAGHDLICRTVVIQDIKKKEKEEEEKDL